MSRTKIGAVLWIACLQYFLAEAVAISRWQGAYSLSRNYISDLGAIRCGVLPASFAGPASTICSPLHALMNASFLLQGALIVYGTTLLRSWFPRSALGAAALLLIGASGFGVVLVGLAPEDVAPIPHYFGALENFVCCNVGMAMMGVALLRWGQGWRRTGLVTLGAGVVGLLGIALLGAHVYLGLGVGGLERVVAYPFPLWLAGMGAMVLRGEGEPAPPGVRTA